MSALKQYFNYRKFSDTSHRILLLDRNYFLQKQSAEQLKQMGHTVHSLPIAEDSRQMLEQILKVSVTFKPDCILTMNHEGFDNEGQIAAVLEELQIPVLIWYLDDFRFILRNTADQVRDNILLFTLEKSNIPALSASGFMHIFYLPTATILNPDLTYVNASFSYLENAVTFVGNSFEDTKNRWMRDGYEAQFKMIESAVAMDLKGNALIEELDRLQGSRFADRESLYHYCGYVAASCTQRYRVSILRSLENAGLHVFGDPHWKSLIKHELCHDGVDPEKGAPYIYCQSGVNMNISSSQLDTAVNLRLYDIPASGGFLITDWRESLEELFNTKEELVTFQDREEVPELCRYYLKNPEIRRKISLAAHKRIRKEHLLRYRLETMLLRAKEIFS